MLNLISRTFRHFKVQRVLTVLHIMGGFPQQTVKEPPEDNFGSNVSSLFAAVSVTLAALHFTLASLFGRDISLGRDI